MLLSPVTRISKILLLGVSCPRDGGDVLAVVFPQLHFTDFTAPSCVDFGPHSAVIPSLNDATAVWKEIEDVCQAGD